MCLVSRNQPTDERISFYDVHLSHAAGLTVMIPVHDVSSFYGKINGKQKKIYLMLILYDSVAGRDRSLGWLYILYNYVEFLMPLTGHA